MTDVTQSAGDTTQTLPAPSFSFEGDGTLVTVDGKKFVPIERFNGLQGPMQKKQLELDALKAQLHDFSQQRETQVSELQAQVDSLKNGSSQFVAQVEDLTKAKTEADAQVAALTRQVETNKLFLSEKYQPLIPSLEKGTLRLDGLEGEALTTYLDTFMAERQSLLENSQQQRGAGGSPPPPAGGATADMTKEQLGELVMKTPYTDPKYQEYYQSYLGAIKGT